MTSYSYFSFSFFFFSLFSTFLLFHPHLASSAVICKDSYCHLVEPAVRFPFRLKYYNSNPRCGYAPDFDLSCNNRSQTILTLPLSGNFVVTQIDYEAQVVMINDPEHCLPRRFLEDFSVKDTPFQVGKYLNVTFFNCSSADINETNTSNYRMLESIPCLSGDNYMVLAAFTEDIENGLVPEIPCRAKSTALVLLPVWQHIGTGLHEDIMLHWTDPDCTYCEFRGGDCRFKSDSGSDIGCFNLPKNGLPRSAKYGLALGVGVPALLCILGLCCFICGKLRSLTMRRNHRAMELSSIIAPPSIVNLTGLDGPTIQSYPKTLLGKSGRLPKPNDNICAICLSEYQPKETIRSIPECKHYFHSECIDEWLSMNVTCPVCRNTPSSTSSPSNSDASSTSFLSL